MLFNKEEETFFRQLINNIDKSGIGCQICPCRNTDKCSIDSCPFDIFINKYKKVENLKENYFHISAFGDIINEYCIATGLNAEGRKYTYKIKQIAYEDNIYTCFLKNSRPIEISVWNKKEEAD